MPIVARESHRPGYKPLVFFRGTIEEAEALSALEIKTALERAGIGRAPSINHIEQLKAAVALQAKEIKSTGRARPKPRLIEVRTPAGQLVLGIKYFPKSGRLVVHQHPVSHGVRHYAADTFQALQKILAKGFRGKSGPNVFLHLRRGFSPWAHESWGKSEIGAELTKGDAYTLELMPLLSHAFLGSATSRGVVEKALPNQLLRINIRLKKGTRRPLRGKKISFYREALAGFPLSFKERKLGQTKGF